MKKKEIEDGRVLVNKSADVATRGIVNKGEEDMAGRALVNKGEQDVAGRAIVNKGDVASRGLVNKGDVASNSEKVKNWNEQQDSKKKKYQYLPTDKKGFVNQVEIS